MQGVCLRGGMLFAVSVIPGNSLAVLLFYLADGHLSGFSQLSSLHLAFFLCHSVFLKHFCARLTPWISARVFRAHGMQSHKVFSAFLCFLWVWDFLELGCFGILGHGKQENVVISILTNMKWAACLKWGGFCKPQWHQLSIRKGCELGVGGEGGFLCASRQLKAGVQSTESCPKGRE